MSSLTREPQKKSIIFSLKGELEQKGRNRDLGQANQLNFDIKEVTLDDRERKRTLEDQSNLTFSTLMHNSEIQNQTRKDVTQRIKVQETLQIQKLASDPPYNHLYKDYDQSFNLPTSSLSTLRKLQGKPTTVTMGAQEKKIEPKNSQQISQFNLQTEEGKNRTLSLSKIQSTKEDEIILERILGSDKKGRNAQLNYQTLQNLQKTQFPNQQRFSVTLSSQNWSQFANNLIEADRREQKEKKEANRLQKLHQNFLEKKGNDKERFQNQIISSLKSLPEADQSWSRINKDLNKQNAKQTIQKVVGKGQALGKTEKFFGKRTFSQGRRNQGQNGIQRKYSMDDVLLTNGSIGQRYKEGQEGEQKKRITFEQDQPLLNKTSSMQLLLTREKSSQEKIKAYLEKEEKIKMEESLKQLSTLQQIRSVNVIKHYKYPSAVEEIVQLTKHKDLDLYEKWRENKILMRRRFQDMQEGQMSRRISENKTFEKAFTMNEREQAQVMLSWFDHVIDQEVRSQHLPEKALSRLYNEQVLLSFILTDLREQSREECFEKGQLFDRIIALFFDMVSVYEMAFDKIISQEVAAKKEQLDKEYLEHKEKIMQKDQEFIQMCKDTEKIKETFESLNNEISAEQATVKILHAKLKVLENLLDSCQFNWKLKLGELQLKSERNLVRNFINQANEFKTFCAFSKEQKQKTKQELQEEIEKEEERILNLLKKKVHKGIQTDATSGNSISTLEKAKKALHLKLIKKKETHLEEEKTTKNKESSKELPKEPIIEEVDEENPKILIQEIKEGPKTTKAQDKVKLDLSKIANHEQAAQDSLGSKSKDEEILAETPQKVESGNAGDILDEEVSEDEIKKQELQEIEEEAIREQQEEELMELLGTYSVNELLQFIKEHEIRLAKKYQDQEIQTEAPKPQGGSLSPRRMSLSKMQKLPLGKPAQSFGAIVLQAMREKGLKASPSAAQKEVAPEQKAINVINRFRKIVKDKTDALVTEDAKKLYAAVLHEMKKLRKDELENLTVDEEDLKPYIKNKAYLKFIYDIVQMLKKGGFFKKMAEKEARDIIREQEEKKKAVEAKKQQKGPLKGQKKKLPAMKKVVENTVDLMSQLKALKDVKKENKYVQTQNVEPLRAGSIKIQNIESDSQETVTERSKFDRVRSKVKVMASLAVGFKNKEKPALSTQGTRRFNQGDLPKNTVVEPFQLGKRGQIVKSQHPMSKLFPQFIQRILERQENEVQPISIKSLRLQVVKIIQEKLTASKDSVSLKNQDLKEFLYDSLFKKYGIPQMTEKKVKEVLISLQRYEQKNHDVRFFAKMVGCGHINSSIDKEGELNFSNNDLTLFYRINKLLCQNDCIVSNYRKEVIFENSVCRLQTSFELIASFFSQKLPKHHVLKFQNKIKNLMESEIKSGNDPASVVTDLYKLSEGVIEYFRDLKQDILKVCTHMDLFDDLDIGFVSLDYPVSRDTLQLDQDNFKDLVQNLQDQLNEKGENKKGFQPYEIQVDQIKKKFDSNSDIVNGVDRLMSVDNVLFCLFDLGFFSQYENLGKEEETPLRNRRQDVAIRIDNLQGLTNHRNASSPDILSPKRGSVCVRSPKINLEPATNNRASFGPIQVQQMESNTLTVSPPNKTFMRKNSIRMESFNKL